MEQEKIFQIGDKKFSKDVTLEAAIKVLEAENVDGVKVIKDCKFISFSLTANPPKGCEFIGFEVEETLDAQDLIDSIDTKIKGPKFK